MSTSYFGMIEALSRHAVGGSRIVQKPRHFDLVHGQPQQRSLTLEQRVTLEQMIGAHAVTRRRLAVRLLPRHAGGDQDLFARLQHEPRVDDTQDRSALALLGGDDLQPARVDGGRAVVLQHEPLFVETFLVGRRVRLAKSNGHDQTSRISDSFLPRISSTLATALSVVSCTDFSPLRSSSSVMAPSFSASFIISL